MTVDRIAPLGHNLKLHTIVETNYFMSRVEKILTEEERSDLVDSLSAKPAQGAVLVGTGGVRKIRFAKGNKGKSGGVRVIYYYYDEDCPVYLLEIFAKSEKGNLSKAEQNALAKLVAVLKSKFERRRL